MIDYRIYCTIYSVCFILYVSSLLFVGSRKRIAGIGLFPIVFGGAVGGASITLFVQYLDWLWS